MKVLRRKKSGQATRPGAMWLNEKNVENYAFRIIAAILFFLFFILPVTPKLVMAEEEGVLFERVKRLEETIGQQEEQLKTNMKALQELKGKVRSMDKEATQKRLVAETGSNPGEEKDTTLEMLRKIIDELRLEKYEGTPEEKKLETIYDDGFFLRGTDDTLKIGGWYQFDGRFYVDDDHPTANTFDNRRVRFDVRGTLENYWGYRLYASFVGSPVIQEAWLEYRYFPYARLKLGQYKEPFSLESQYSARWIDFVERSMGVTALQPSEDIGVMLFGTFLEKRATYGIGYFNGQGRDKDAVVDDKDLTGRLVLQPFRHQNDSLFEKLYIGGSFGFGNNERDFGNRDFTTAGGTTFFDFVSDAQSDGDLIRYDAELEWLKGPFDLTTEFIGTHFDEIKAGNAADELTVSSWYATLSYVLTGENAVRNKPIKPHRNFDLKQAGWGAWQLLVRYEHFWIEDENLIDKGIASGTDEADAFSLGLNWWPNFHLKFMFNFVHTAFDDEITVSNQKMDDENVILIRAQFNF